MAGSGEQKANMLGYSSMAIRECQVSFVDQRGIRHSVAVYASTVLEAAAAGLKQIREMEMIGDDGVEDLTVDIKSTTSHKVPYASNGSAWIFAGTIGWFVIEVSISVLLRVDRGRYFQATL